MNLLKVICNAAAGATVFEFGKKDKTYDWEKSALLVDCIYRVFYNTPSEWSGSIEVYFELKGKNYCAGRKMHNGKSSIYLAGEVNGKLLLLAFDNEAMHAYLDDEAGCDFNYILERCLISKQSFASFCDSPSLEHFGMIKKAQEEKSLAFDLGLVQALKAKTANTIKKADVEAAKDKLAEIKEQRESLTRSLADLKSEQEELNELMKDEEKRQALLLKKQELEGREKQIGDSVKRLEESEKACAVVALMEKEKAIDEEIVRAKEEKENQNKLTSVLVAAQVYNEKKEAIQKEEKQQAELADKRSELVKSKEQAEEKITALEKEKLEITGISESEQKKAAQEEQERKKAQTDLEKAQKEQLRIKADIEKLQTEIQSVQSEKEQAKDEVTEIEGLGLTQAAYNKEQERERLSKIEVAEAEKKRSELLAKKDNIDAERKSAQAQVDEVKAQIESVDKKQKMLSAEKAEIEFDLNPANILSTTKKYFGRGCTPDGVNKKKKALKERAEQISQELAQAEADRKNLNATLEEKNKALADIEKSSEGKGEDIIIPQAYTAPIYEYDGVKGIYIAQLKEGKGDEFVSGKKQRLAALEKKLKEAKDALSKQAAQAQSADKECKKLQELLEKPVSSELPVFEKEKELATARKERDELVSKIEKTDKELQNAKKTALEKPSKEIKEYLKPEVNIALLLSETAVRRKDADNKLKQLEDDKKNNTVELRKAEKELAKPNIVAQKLVLTQNEKQAIEEEIQAFRAEYDSVEKSLSEIAPLPEGTEDRAKEVTAAIAEAESAIIEKDRQKTLCEGNYERIRTEYKEYREALKELDLAIAAVDAVKDRRFASNTQAADYVAEYIARIGKLLKKLTDNRYTVAFDDGMSIFDANREKLEWDALQKDDKLLVYIACACALPNVDQVQADWLLIDGEIPENIETFEKAYSVVKLKHMFKVQFTEKERPVDDVENKSEDEKATDENTVVTQTEE